MELDYFNKIVRSLLPKGIFWQGRNFLSLMEGIALIFKRIYEDIKKINSETFPTTALETLDEWESFLNITNISNDIEKRRLEIVSRLISTGGNTLEYFLLIAQSFNKEATILKKSNNNFRAGISRAGDALGTGDSENFVANFLFSDTSKKDLIISTLNKAKPAHVIFLYKFRS